MARNGTGSYNLAAGNPVVNGTTITDTWANTTLGDIATALTASIANDGQTPILANLPMGTHKLTGLAVGINNGDSVRFEQTLEYYADATGTSDVITASYANAPTNLYDGYRLTLGVVTPNTTTTPTFAPTTGGVLQTAHTIVKLVGNTAVALAVGDLQGDADLRYDLPNTRWVLKLEGFSLSTSTPIMDGIAAVGTGTTSARADHVHASDTSRALLAGSSGQNFAANALTAVTYNGYTFTGTAAQTYTFPTTTATLARTDAAQSFTGLQTFSTGITSTAAANSFGATAFSGAITGNQNASFGTITSTGIITSGGSEFRGFDNNTTYYSDLAGATYIAVNGSTTASIPSTMQFVTNHSVGFSLSSTALNLSVPITGAVAATLGAVSATVLTASSSSEGKLYLGTTAGAGNRDWVIDANGFSTGVLSFVVGTSFGASPSVTAATLSSTGLAVTGAISATTTITPGQTQGIVGTTTNNNVQAGSVGEFLTSTPTATATLATTIAGTGSIASLALTAGDWDVTVTVSSGSAASNGYGQVGLSPTSGSISGLVLGYNLLSWGTGTNGQFCASIYSRLSLSGSATYYVVGNANVAITSLVGVVIQARRVR